MRVVIADDEALLREGLARLLEDAGFEVAGPLRRRRRAAAHGRGAPAGRRDRRHPHAAEPRRRRPARRPGDPPPPSRTSACSCSPTTSTRATRCGCSRRSPNGAGYLLKERVSDVAVLADALRRIDEGECVIDPTIVSRLVARKRERGPLDALTEREREVLALVAEGHSNGAIGDQLFLSRKTVEAHISQIFLKLDLRESPDDHRRVLAVLAFLRSEEPPPTS